MTTPIGDSAQGGAEGTQSGAGESTEVSGNSGTASTESAQSGANPVSPAAETVAKAELEQQRARTRAADERAARLDAELKQLRDKDLPEVEKLKRDFEETQQQVTTLRDTNQKLALQVAFLKDNTYSWHNPETALKLVDLSQVTVEEDGSVSGLKDALKALATSNDFLVRKEATTEAPKPASTASGNNGGAGGSAPKRSQLAARFPALNTRVRRS